MTLHSTFAFVPTFRKLFLSDPTAPWASLRGQARIYFHELSTGTFSLVSQHIDECGPTRIVHRSGKHTSCQSLDIQLLDSNHRIGLYQSCRQLMQEVRSLVTHLAMDGGYGYPILILGTLWVASLRLSNLSFVQT